MDERPADSPDPGRPGWPERIVRSVRRDLPLVVFDLAVVFAAYLAPLVLRFDGAVPLRYWHNFWFFGGIAAFLHLVSNYLFGLYGQMWRYASVQEARRVVLAGSTAGGLVVAADLLAGSPRPLPLSVVILGAGVSLMGHGAIRFQSRLFGFRRREEVETPARILVMGAGDGGAALLQDILHHPNLGLDPVGVVDDDPRKVGRTLRGVRIEGSRSAIPSLVSRLRVDEVLLAIPSARGEVVRDVAALCEEAEVTLRVLPSVREIVGGRVSARDIRDLRIEDLLGREQVDTDVESVAAIVRGRRVMVTGAGGSIGSEVARQVAALEPSSLLLLDRDETHLHDLLVELNGSGPAEVVLADVRDRVRMAWLFSVRRPEVVFHAAAHKHVPVLETHPEEAVLTNVLGTANVAHEAVASGVERLVLISTDKAVRPVSVMGASKWFAEQIVRSYHGSGSVLCAVRFGNVLGSRGSVIPTFLRQISRGGPLTVTHPSMARFFMSVQEAVQLVLQAAALSTGGEVFTLDMGQPVNILDLARKVIRLSGRVPDLDIPIAIVGIRPGEKLVEDVADPSEEVLPSSHPAIRVSQPSTPDRASLRAAIRELETMALEGRSLDLAVRIKALATQVPVAEPAGGIR
jgi:FlaA1/EpsC-like NDP-sugar epimerase